MLWQLVAAPTGSALLLGRTCSTSFVSLLRRKICSVYTGLPIFRRSLHHELVPGFTRGGRAPDKWDGGSAQGASRRMRRLFRRRKPVQECHTPIWKEHREVIHA